MILDELIRGTLDQGRNCLIVFEEESRPNDSVAAYEYIITYKFKNEDGVDLTEECIKAKEQAVYRLAAIFQ